MKIQASTTRAATRAASAGSAPVRLLSTAAKIVRKRGRVGIESTDIMPRCGLAQWLAKRAPRMTQRAASNGLLFPLAGPYPVESTWASLGRSEVGKARGAERQRRPDDAADHHCARRSGAFLVARCRS